MERCEIRAKFWLDHVEWEFFGDEGIIRQILKLILDKVSTFIPNGMKWMKIGSAEWPVRYCDETVTNKFWII